MHGATVRFNEYSFSIAWRLEMGLIITIQIYNDVSVKQKLYYVYYCIRATCFDSYRIIFRPF